MIASRPRAIGRSTGEHTVWTAVAFGDAAGRHQVGRSGCFETDVAESGRDGVISAGPEWTEVRRDVH